MSADELLARLERVKKRSGDSWSARCPAHDDRGPSLSIRELGDGRVLAHCFAGCGIEQILDSVGLDFDAIMPPRQPGEHFQRPRFAFSASDAMRTLSREAYLVAIAAHDLSQGIPLTEHDRQRLIQSAALIEEARRLCDA